MEHGIDGYYQLGKHKLLYNGGLLQTLFISGKLPKDIFEVLL